MAEQELCNESTGSQTDGPCCEAYDAEGYCLVCGKRVHRPATEHLEITLNDNLGAISDRGRQHRGNQDRCTLGDTGAETILVVCDGVSSSPHAERAAEAASAVLRERLVRAFAENHAAGVQQAMEDAFVAAQHHLEDHAGPADSGDAPATTAIAALVRGRQVAVGWAGDSRAYWITAEDAHLLTCDHTWAEEAVRSGALTREEAEAAPAAHALVRWLGHGAGEAASAEVVLLAVDGPGTLVLCSDGLWNYAPSAREMAGWVTAAQTSKSAIEAARALVDKANSAGGHDNITVALLRIPATPLL